METITRQSGKDFKIDLSKILSIENRWSSLSEKIETGMSLGERKTLVYTVSELGKKENLATLLTYIGNNDSLFNNVLASSYKHHNGFHKIVLLAGSAFKLRLHLFRPIAEISDPMENIHDHRWNFASNIIDGKLTMELFAENEHGNIIMNNYSYSGKGESKQYEVKYNGKVHLQRLSTMNYESGCTYFMKSQELHRIISPDSINTCTLMMTGIPLVHKCKLYSNSTFSGEKQEVLPYDKNELCSLFQSVIEL